MKAGTLRHRIVIECRDTTQDEYGAQSDTWTEFVTLSASIEPIRGRELLSLQTVNNEITTKITARYYPGITSDMRIVFGTVTYNILSTVNIEMRNRELQFLCSTWLVGG